MDSHNTLLRRAAFASCLIAVSQICAQPAAIGHQATPGLLRLREDPKPGEAAKLTTAKFAVDDLAPNAVPGAAKGKKDDVDVLTLEPGNYTAHARADTVGEVLLEVYFVD